MAPQGAPERRADPQGARRETGPVTDRGVVRRLELLAAARRVFEAQGYVDTRVADIVRAAGASQGTFYTYFDSKEAVFQEVADQAVGRMLADLHADAVADDPVERIRDSLRRFVHAYRPAARILSLLEQVGTSTPELKALRLAMREAFVQRTVRGLERWQADGTADPALDPQLTAEVLGSMVDSVCHVWMNLGREFDEDALLDVLTTVWSRALGVAPARRHPVQARGAADLDSVTGTI
ncbi:MAG TPA: TetR/AcrR family transcriptional regulator [Mycobacteriales bacterium]|jgi:AcrR family transcriptional regulator|nr:TetR/AcrR family transcriptional regulator [Mycobacteriales bacterium]